MLVHMLSRRLLLLAPCSTARSGLARMRMLRAYRRALAAQRWRMPPVQIASRWRCHGPCEALAQQPGAWSTHARPFTMQARSPPGRAPSWTHQRSACWPARSRLYRHRRQCSRTCQCRRGSPPPAQQLPRAEAQQLHAWSRTRFECMGDGMHTCVQVYAAAPLVLHGGKCGIEQSRNVTRGAVHGDQPGSSVQAQPQGSALHRLLCLQDTMVPGHQQTNEPLLA